MNESRLLIRINTGLEVVKEALATDRVENTFYSSDFNIPVLQLLSVLDKIPNKKDRLIACNMCLLINPTVNTIIKNTIVDLDNMLLKQEPFYVSFKMYYIACYKCILEGEGDL